MPHPRLAAAAAGILVATLVGCTAPVPSTGGGQTSAPAPASSGAAKSGQTTSDATSAADVGIDPANPPKALASSALTSDLGTMRISVLRCQRNGQLLHVVFAVTPETTKAERKRLWDWMGGYFRPYLIDAKNLKKYDSILRTSDLDTYLLPGKTSYVYAVFAAPPADVTALDVVFSSTSGAPMNGVPIS